MPSSPGYKRQYDQEYKTAVARGEVGTGHNSGNAKRHRLRRAAIKAGMIKEGDARDIDHKQALAKGGSNSLKNARPVSKHDNRSFPRTKKAGMKANI